MTALKITGFLLLSLAIVILIEMTAPQAQACSSQDPKRFQPAQCAELSTENAALNDIDRQRPEKHLKAVSNETDSIKTALRAGDTDNTYPTVLDKVLGAFGIPYPEPKTDADDEAAGAGGGAGGPCPNTALKRAGMPPPAKSASTGENDTQGNGGDCPAERGAQLVDFRGQPE